LTGVLYSKPVGTLCAEKLAAGFDGRPDQLTDAINNDSGTFVPFCAVGEWLT